MMIGLVCAGMLAAGDPSEPGPSHGDARLSASGVVFATYLGGTQVDGARGVAVDACGNVFVTGQTNSPDLPVKNAFQPTFAGGPEDAYLAKFSPAGELLFSTYLGGPAGGHDIGWDVATDSQGDVYVVGQAECGFPVLNAFQGRCVDNADGFVAKFSGDGDLLFSTFFGGSSTEEITAVTVDANDNAHVVGYTYSNDLPILNAAFPSFSVAGDAFVADFSPSGTLLYSTYYGGSKFDIGYGISVDPDGFVSIVGDTVSDDLPTLRPLGGRGANFDGFVARFAPGGSPLEFATYLGGAGIEHVLGVASSATETCVAGSTQSGDFPVRNAIQPVISGDWDGFVTCVDPRVPEILYSTFVGGTLSDTLADIALDASGAAHVTGTSYSADYPRVNAMQPVLKGPCDLTYTRLARGGGTIEESTFLGGSDRDLCFAT